MMRITTPRCLLHAVPACLIGLLAASLPAASPRSPVTIDDFVSVKDGRFHCQGREYRAMGFTCYELNVGNWHKGRDRIEMVFRAAKEHGFSLFRATSIIYEFGKGDLDQNLSDQTWTQMDLLLDVARSLDMKVLIDFSTLTWFAGHYTPTPFDVCAPEHFERLRRIYATIPNRRNSVNGRIYRQDPTIFGWSILGEVVPFGRKADNTTFHPDSNRNVDDYVTFVSRAAAELKRNDPIHLVNGGGLLHLKNNNVPKDRTRSDYWRTVWANRNIDFGSVHIYTGPPKGTPLPAKPPYDAPMPWGEWRNLGEYVAYTDTIGKPFMVEEWGINQDQRSKESDGSTPLHSPQSAQDFVTSAYDCMVAAKVPASVMWQWGPGKAFNIWPGESPDEDALVAIIKRNAVHFQPDPEPGRGRPAKAGTATSAKVAPSATPAPMISAAPADAQKDPFQPRSAPPSLVTTMDRRLLSRIRSELGADRTPRFRSAQLGSEVYIDRADAGGALTLVRDGGRIDSHLDRLTGAERIELARRLLRENQADDHALLAFLLLRHRGDAEDARRHLAAAGAAARDVAAAFP